MPYTISSSIAESAKEAFDFYSANLKLFLKENPAGRLFIFIDTISKEYTPLNKPLASWNNSISRSDISGEDESIDQNTFYLGFITFLQNISGGSPVSNFSNVARSSAPAPLPQEAFEYQGHNKLNIRESMHTYSLLAE